jgi:hypothetical protein
VRRYVASPYHHKADRDCQDADFQQYYRLCHRSRAMGDQTSDKPTPMEMFRALHRPGESTQEE